MDIRSNERKNRNITLGNKYKVLNYGIIFCVLIFLYSVWVLINDSKISESYTVLYDEIYCASKVCYDNQCFELVDQIVRIEIVVDRYEVGGYVVKITPTDKKCQKDIIPWKNF